MQRKRKSSSSSGPLRGKGGDDNEINQTRKVESAPAALTSSRVSKTAKPVASKSNDADFDRTMEAAVAIILKYNNLRITPKTDEEKRLEEFISSMATVVNYIHAKPKESLFKRSTSSEAKQQDAIILEKSKDILTHFIDTHREIMSSGGRLSWQDALIEMTGTINRIHAESPQEMQARRENESRGKQQALKERSELIQRASAIQKAEAAQSAAIGEQVANVLMQLEVRMGEVAKDKRNHRSPNAKAALKEIEQWRAAIESMVHDEPRRNQSEDLRRIKNLPHLIAHIEMRLKAKEENPKKTKHTSSIFQEKYVRSGERDRNAAAYKSILREAVEAIDNVKATMNGPSISKSYK